MTIAGVDVDGQNVSVAGYVDGIVEDGGACTYVATEKATRRTVTIPGSAVRNVTTTSCGTSSEPLSSFSKGSWSVVLNYVSKTNRLSSSPLALEIP